MIFFKSSIIFLVLDIIWITFNLDIYKNLVYKISNKHMNFNKSKLYSILITYIFLLLGLNYIVIPYNIPLLFGLIVYGVYSFTNYSLFNNYPVKLAIIDTIWGAVLYYLANLLK